MASTSKSARRKGIIGEEVADEEEDETLDELERFDDFTLASSWERFISEIESVCRLWMVDGPKNLTEKGAECLDDKRKLYKVKSEVKYGIKSYWLEYYFEMSRHGQASLWDDGSHDLQISFGVGDFLVISPISASGVVLDAPESTKLLSAVAIALTNCSSNWPAFVPVHDPSRRAYMGIQNMDLSFTRRFDADRIGSQVPVRLMHLEGLYELFVSKFAMHSVDFSMNLFKVHFGMKLTYRTPTNDYDDEMGGAGRQVNGSLGDANMKSQWDDDCPWSEWYTAEDPVTGFELIAVWSKKVFEGSHEMAELENASSFDAEKWFLYPLISLNMIDDSMGKLVGFASQLQLLVNALDASFEAQFLEDLVTADKPASDSSKSTTAIPPPTVTDRTLKEIFHDGSNMERENKYSRAIKGAPLESLFAQFCLHSLWFGGCNIRAIVVLWLEFVREVRWCWVESQPLPNISTDCGIDLSSCLIHQKLQMLSICIGKKNDLKDEVSTEAINNNRTPSGTKVDGQAKMLTNSEREIDSSLGSHWTNDFEQNVTSSSNHTSYAVESSDTVIDDRRRGSAGIVDSMMLLGSYEMMHAPYTQDAPIMTEDMHEERLRAVEAFGDAFTFSGQLEKDILSSDMSAFKAANPDSVFEDFIRWHSPGDWEVDEIEDDAQYKSEWPPHGKLSKRMSEHGNLWRQIWNNSPPLPASEQKPLLDPIQEGEKILHYLETLPPYELLEQMVCTGFRAAADTLDQTLYGNIKPMKTRMRQLYQTLSSNLRSLQVNKSADKTELIGDLRRLCDVFEHIEKLLILAASLHRKLSDVPRLSEAVFNNYFEFYLPKLGTSLENICYDKEFETKEPVLMHERESVASLFPPPTANQSWRKVLSMGNLLNGHEPILREIVFFNFDKVTNSTYGSNIPEAKMEEIQTHRMYICGTSNDLRVALSVTSWD